MCTDQYYCCVDSSPKCPLYLSKEARSTLAFHSYMHSSYHNAYHLRHSAHIISSEHYIWNLTTHLETCVRYRRPGKCKTSSSSLATAPALRTRVSVYCIHTLYLISFVLCGI